MRLIYYFLNVHRKGGLPDLMDALTPIEGSTEGQKVSYFKATLKIKEYVLNSKSHL